MEISRRSSSAIGVSHFKRSQAISASQVPIVYSKKSEERPENIWSWRDLKTTVARSLNHYREDYGKGL